MSRFEKNSVCEGLAGVGVASVFSYTTMDTKESQATRSRLTQALFLGPPCPSRLVGWCPQMKDYVSTLVGEHGDVRDQLGLKHRVHNLNGKTDE